jgi:hypothetical protein
MQVDDGDQNRDIAGSSENTALLRLNMTSFAAPTTWGDSKAYAYIEASNSVVYGYAKITGYTSGTAVSATVVDDFAKSTATDAWAESAWSARRGWPRTCALFEQRMYYASNTDQPLTLWATRIGDFENFIAGTEDDQGFSDTMPLTERNPIVWIEAQRNLIICTGKEFGVLGSGSDDLTMTPSNKVFRLQGAVGFGTNRPLIVGNVMIGVERNQRRLRELVYDIQLGQTGGYAANNLNRLNDEIAEAGIKDMAFMQLREPCLVCVMGDGTIGILAYNREDNIVGWTKWTTQGEFESCAIIRGTDYDELWVSVKRTINDAVVRFVERLRPTIATTKEDAFYVDCGVSYSGSAITTMTGLAHLNGEECHIIGDGAVYDNATPSVGSIPLKVSGTTTSATKVSAGLGYTSIHEPMRLDTDPQFGNTQGHQKTISEVIVRLYKSLGMTWNNGKTNYDLSFRNTDDEMDESPPLFTGQKKITWDSTYGENPDDNDPKLIIKQTQPLPMTILAIVVKYLVSPR